MHLLGQFPKLSAVKLARKLQAKVGDLPASDRSIRRYVRRLKEVVASAPLRYYEPILDDVPGVQCQVDPGELRGALIGSETGPRLCQQLKRSEPKIYKDQLVAARDLLKRHAPVDPALLMALADRPGMTATRLRSYLEAAQAARRRERQPEPLPAPKDVLDLIAYRHLGRSSGQGVTHEPA